MAAAEEAERAEALRADAAEAALGVARRELDGARARSGALGDLEARYWHDFNDFQQQLRAHVDERDVLLRKVRDPSRVQPLGCPCLRFRYAYRVVNGAHQRPPFWPGAAFKSIRWPAGRHAGAASVRNSLENTVAPRLSPATLAPTTADRAHERAPGAAAADERGQRRVPHLARGRVRDDLGLPPGPHALAARGLGRDQRRLGPGRAPAAHLRAGALAAALCAPARQCGLPLWHLSPSHMPALALPAACMQTPPGVGLCIMLNGWEDSRDAWVGLLGSAVCSGF